MDAQTQSWIREYSTPPNNYIGTFLFLSYILAALSITFNITLRIYSQYQIRKTSLSSIARRQVQLCSVFAILSFAVLSFNMVSVLAESFFAWHERTGAARLSLRTWVATKTGTSSISIAHVPSLLWNWMIQTSLFDNFAQDLMRDWTSRLFTVISIMQAAVNAAEMSVDGHANDKRSSLPQLTQFFLLAQILPPSFSFFLFKIALILHDPTQADKREKEPRKVRDPNDRMSDPGLIFLLKTEFMLGWIIFHLVALIFIPDIVSSDFYQQAIWGIRALLISSLFINPPQFLALRLGDLVMDKPLDLAQAFLIVGGRLAPAVSSRWYPGSTFEAIASGLNVSNMGLWNAGPAVRALAMDWIVGKAGVSLLRKLERKGKLI